MEIKSAEFITSMAEYTDRFPARDCVRWLFAASPTWARAA